MAILPNEFPAVLTIFLALGAWRISRKRVLTRRVPGARDARLGHRAVRRQDRHAHAEPDDGAQARLARRDASTSPPSRRSVAARARSRAGRVRDPREPARPVRSDGEGVQGARRAPARGHRAPAPELDAGPRVSRCPTSCWRCRTSGARRTEPSTSSRPRAPPRRSPISATSLRRRTRASTRAVPRRWPARACACSASPRRRSGRARCPRSSTTSTFELRRPRRASPIRSARRCPAAIAECYAAGIRVVMITGDHPRHRAQHRPADRPARAGRRA